MRSLFIFLMILIGLAIWLIPYGDGLLFKYQFTNYIHQLQNLTNRDKKIQIVMSDYHVGWLKSSAHIAVSINNTKQPVEFDITTLIHHGPILFIDGQVKYAFAWIEGFVHRPDIFSDYVTDTDKGIMQISTLLEFNKYTWTNFYVVPETTLAGIVHWKGLTGQADVITNGFVINEITNNVKIGQVNLQAPGLPYQIIIEPITDKLDVKFSGNQKVNAAHDTNFGAMTLTAANNVLLQIKSASMNSSMSNANDTFNGSSDGSINNITSSLAGDLNSISEIKYHFKASDFNSNGLSNIKYYADKLSNSNTRNYNDLMDAILKSLNAASKIEISLSTNTNLGSFSNTTSISLAQKPASLPDLAQQLNFEVKGRIARKLAEFVLTEFYRYTFAQQKLMKMQELRQIQEKEKPIEIANQSLHANAFTQAVSDMVTEGSLSTDQSFQIMNLANSHPPIDVLSANLTQMGIGKVNVLVLINAYKEQYLSNIPAAASATPAAAELDPAVVASTTIDEFIKNGILTADGVDLIVTISKSGSIINFNGSTDNDYAKILATDINDLLVNGVTPNNH